VIQEAAIGENAPTGQRTAAEPCAGFHIRHIHEQMRVTDLSSHW
jgi:hypothetical protein